VSPRTKLPRPQLRFLLRLLPPPPLQQLRVLFQLLLLQVELDLRAHQDPLRLPRNLVELLELDNLVTLRLEESLLV